MSGPKVPTGPWWWWRDGCGGPVRVIDAGDPGAPSLRFWTMALPGTYAVTDDGRWIAPVLTPAEAAALTAERDEARQWAEAAAADENANAADLREARATLDAVAALVGGGDVVAAVAALVAKRDRKRTPALKVPNLHNPDALLAWLDAEPGEVAGALYFAMDSRDQRWCFSMLPHHSDAKIRAAIRATLAAPRVSP